MRVTFISDEWRRNGGVGSYVQRLAAALVARGHEVQVVHNDRAAVSLAEVREDYVEGCTAYAQSRGHRETASQSALDAVRGFMPDIVHVQSCNNFALERALRERYRATKSLHVYDFCPSNTKFHHALGRECSHPTSLACLPRLGYKRCTTSRRPSVWLRMQRRAHDANANNAGYARLIVASEHVRQQALATGYPEEQVDVVPYFVPAADAPDPEPRLVLAPGRLTREKGFDLFIDAMAQVPRPWRAIVAGDGMERAALERHAAARGVRGEVEFVGWQDEAGMAALFRRAAVIAVPSRWPEPSGIVGLEAMAVGRPAVAFAVGGIPEWLQHDVTGLLAPPLDTAAMARNIARLFDNPAEAARMGAAGRARVAAEFSEQSHVARLSALYDALPAAG